MPLSLDWLNVAPSPPARSFFNPAIPNRGYGLTAADAVSLGRQALPDLEASVAFGQLQQKQALAPFEAQVEQMKLRNALETQPQIAGSRDAFITGIAGLDPASADYLKNRRDIINQNPYGIADPVAQEVLRANDRAYDDYVQTERLRLLTEPKQLTASQRAMLEKQMTATTAKLQQATAMGDTEMASRYQEELSSLTRLLTNTSADTAPTATDNLSTSASSTPPDLSGLSEEQMWQKSKESLLGAAQKEANDTGTSVLSVIRKLADDPSYADTFFGKHVGARGSSRAFMADRPWYAGDDVTWNDLVMALQGDAAMLQGEGITPREARAPQGFSDIGKTREASSERGSWKITPLSK